MSRTRAVSTTNNSAAVAPNHVELTAMRDAGTGAYNSKEAFFVRRFSSDAQAAAKTAQKAIVDFQAVRKAHGTKHNILLFVLRTEDATFSQQVMNDIDHAQRDLKTYVLHEPDINQPLSSLKQQYAAAARRFEEVVIVLDPATASLPLLRQKAEFAALQGPRLLLVQHRNPFAYADGYMQLMAPFLDLPTKVIDVGVWPRYVTHGKRRGQTMSAAPVMCFGIDAICHGVPMVGGKNPKVLFLNGDVWEYVPAARVTTNPNVGGRTRRQYLAQGMGQSYPYSRADAVFELDRSLQDLKAMTVPQLQAAIARSQALAEIAQRFAGR